MKAFLMGFSIAFFSSMAIALTFPELGAILPAVMGFVISMVVNLFIIK